MSWFTLFSLLLPLLNWLLKLLASLDTVNQLSLADKAKLARAFNRIARVVGHADRIGLSLTSKEVAEARD